MANVELINVVKCYNSNKILNNINIEIKDGEFIVILGPSGCGKSTLLRLIAGLEKITTGSILIADHDVCNLEPKDRKVAMVFQNYALYPHMNVYKNIAYSLILQKMPKEEIEKKVKNASELLQLKDLLYRKPNQLSGGQRQRVAMGRALVRNPNVFLFDEPLSNLDAKLRTQMRFEIKNIHKKLNTTSIYVTHDQVEAMTLADRIILLNKGHVEQIGKPLELYKNPASIFVGGFIGNPPMNFMSFNSAKLILKTLTIPDNVIIGFRPEDIIIEEKESIHSTKLKIKMIEYVGYESLIYGVEENSGSEITVKSINHSQKFSDYIYIKISQNILHFFDSKSEKKMVN